MRLQETVKQVKELVKVFIGALTLCVILVLRPFMIVRIGRIRSYRIGSFVGDLDRHLAYSRESRKRTVELNFLENERVSNAFVEVLWRRQIYVFPRLVLESSFKWITRKAISSSFWSEHLWSTMDIDHWSPILGERDPWNILDSAQPTLRLSESEMRRGRAQLSEFGISPESRIALLVGRDSAYGTIRGDSPQSHTHRNVQINDFEPSIDLLRQKGFTVFRMGSVVQEKLKCADERSVFDYATNGMRSEFLDVYLASICALCVSVLTGYDQLPTLFRKPILYVNMVPIGMYPSYRRSSLALCESFTDLDSGDFISLNELYRRGCFFDFNASKFRENGVGVVDNSPRLLRDAVDEAITHLVNKEAWSKEDESAWMRFREQFEPIASRYPIKIHGDLLAYYSPSGLRSGHFGIFSPTT